MTVPMVEGEGDCANGGRGGVTVPMVEGEG